MVRKQNSKIGHHRIVIRQGKAKVTFTGKDVTAQAGMVLVASAMEVFDLRSQFTDIFQDMDFETKYGASSMLEQLIALQLMGGEAISDTAIFAIHAMTALFDWDTIGHGSTFGRRLKQFNWRHNLGLQQVVSNLYQRLGLKGKRLLAIDSTVATVFGEPKGADKVTILTSPGGYPITRFWLSMLMHAPWSTVIFDRAVHPAVTGLMVSSARSLLMSSQDPRRSSFDWTRVFAPAT